MAAEYRRQRVARAPKLSADVERALTRHRERIAERQAVKTADALVRMVDDLGFCFAFTSEAAYPIPAAFDHLDARSDSRKWEWMWPWKDELAEAKKLYYGKLLVKKPTFVSMKMLPVFYATFGRAGETDDHVDDVRAGRLTDLARRVVEYLAHRGETQKKRMRADLGIESKEGAAISNGPSRTCSGSCTSPASRRWGSAATTTTTRTTSSCGAIPRR